MESRVVWCRSGMPIHSSRSSAPSGPPQMQAVAHDVVGRRTPTAARSRPVSALNVEDLPEPVAPAIATTVCSGGEPQPGAGPLDDRRRRGRPPRRPAARGTPRPPASSPEIWSARSDLRPSSRRAPSSSALTRHPLCSRLGDARQHAGPRSASRSAICCAKRRSSTARAASADLLRGRRGDLLLVQPVDEASALGVEQRLHPLVQVRAGVGRPAGVRPGRRRPPPAASARRRRCRRRCRPRRR